MPTHARRHAKVMLVLLLLVMVGVSAPARAAPSLEDAILDGELDNEDVVGGLKAVARSAPGGHAWVSLVGFSKRSFTQEREYAAALVIGLPFDRVARVASRRDVAARPFTPVAAPTTDGADLAPVVSPRLARECVGAAWRSAGLGSDDERIDAIVARARYAALLPETRLRAIRTDDARLSNDVTDDTSRLRDSAGANLALEARLTWRLDRLLYADDETSLERMKLERHDARSRVAARVLDALFHWQRAWFDTYGRGGEGARREDAPLRMVEAEITLDVLTGGWFSVWRAARPPTAPTGPEPRRTTL